MRAGKKLLATLFAAFAVALTFASATLPTPAVAFELALPIKCDLGKSCFLQNYVDTVSGPGVGDFGCGAATYDGHKGIDFRLISTHDVKRGVAVLAAADGIVKGRRDGVPDIVYIKAHKAKLKGRECGNGVFIDHGKGWETQYCHLRRGSVRVRRGQKVMRGTRLGDVGYSGQAAFAHLHLSVRHNGKVIDPFTGNTPSTKPGDGACTIGSIRPGSLWSSSSVKSLAYRSAQIIDMEFLGQRPASIKSETGLKALARPTRSSPVFLFAARAIKLNAGDRLRLHVNGPRGLKLNSTTKPMDRAKATYATFIGRKRRGKPWPRGIYRGRVELLRAGRVIARKDNMIDLK